ncbi:hypothetical protein SAY87_018394 [Trapa incisa]|uniref:Uncharacterized protein n=1 Tax=Trapa incisa TaxID=236973 RepID=A0AAN7LC38_9MYRT|nr:hypothetical protein SAY87_018394 [Trapa incisa]
MGEEGAWEGASVKSLVMAARILANLIVMGGGILARAFVQAYRQALTNASKNGTAQEAMQNTIRRASKAMTEQEARQILGIQEGAAWEEILKKYDVLFERNAKNGSFYLQSKVHRAKECLEMPYNPDDLMVQSESDWFSMPDAPKGIRARYPRQYELAEGEQTRVEVEIRKMGERLMEIEGKEMFSNEVESLKLVAESLQLK